MKITREWLERHNACEKGKEWFLDQGVFEPIAGIKNLIEHDKLDWANWLTARVLNRKQRIMYAVYAAELVLGIFEAEYPKDESARNAINAAKGVIKRDTKETRAAAAAAYAAADTTAADTAADAAYAAAAYFNTRVKILNYGLGLLGVQGEN